MEDVPERRTSGRSPSRRRRRPGSPTAAACDRSPGGSNGRPCAVDQPPPVPRPVGPPPPPSSTRRRRHHHRVIRRFPRARPDGTQGAVAAWGNGDERGLADRSGRASSVRTPPSAAPSCSTRTSTAGSSPASPIRRVHSDASMFIGGLRALLFQSMHPLAMAGVAQHSDYRHDPWGRLQRTADFLAATTFGPASRGAAGRRRRAPRARPRRRRGLRRSPVLGQRPAPAARGCTSPNSTASSPPTTATAPMPLIGDERDRYVAEVGVVARALGVSAPPETERGLRRPAPIVPTGAARHDRGTRRGALPAPAAAAAARGPAGLRPDRRRPRSR